MRIRRSQDAGRLQRREDRMAGHDMQKRQELEEGFEIFVQTISGGFLVTLTHAIESQLTSSSAPGDAIAVPSLPTSVSSSSSETTSATAEDVVETAEAISGGSSASESISTSLPEVAASSSAPLPTEAATETGASSFDSLISSFRTTTTTTSINPMSEIATETPVVVEAEGISEGDADRVPAAGIALGAAGGASALILGAVLALKLSRRKRGKVGGDSREFKKMEG